MRKTENAQVVKETLQWGGMYPIKFTFTDSVNGTRCRMYVNGFLVGSCGGGGYDMRGTALAEFLSNAYKAELGNLWEQVKDLPDTGWNTPHRPYGMYEGGSINGCAGLNCMVEIAGLIGLEIWWDCETRSYMIRKKEG